MLARRLPGLTLHGVVADFERHLDRLPDGGPRLVAFLGGTIGNLEPVAAGRVPRRAARRAGAAATRCCSGTDLVKDPSSGSCAAYDDAAGVTAEFNRNVLRVLNRELGADFDPERSSTSPCGTPTQEWIEMRLASPATR